MLQSYSNFAKSFDPSLKIQASNKIHLKFNLSFIQVFPDIRSWRITTQQAFFTSLRLAETPVTCQTLSIDLLTVRYRRPTPISSTSPLRSPLLILLNLGREPSIPPSPPRYRSRQQRNDEKNPCSSADISFHEPPIWRIV